MSYPDESIEQLKLINQKLEKFLNPKKMIWHNFLYGVFRALGYLFGTVVIASIIIYLLFQSEIGQSIKTWIESNQPIYQISVPVPDQP